MITFSIETLEQCLEELKPLLKDHHKEVALYQDKVEYNPDFEKYAVLEDQGSLRTVVAREDGGVVGYFISFITPHLHYKDTLYAHNDVIYLAPRLRHSLVARDMVEFAVNDLKELGVDVVTLHMKTSVPFQSLANSTGFGKVEYIYSKYIGK